jgi:urease accessory protein
MLAPAPPAGRRAEARLAFALAGGRTRLVRQHVPYPVHVTRPFHIEAARPGLATLYLQSASGGIYRGDDVGLVLDVAAGAAVHVTTQAATVVHDSRGEGCRQAVAIRVGEGAFCAFVPDPVVMFPGAAFSSEMTVDLAPGAMAILTDGVCRHDPAGGAATFERWEGTTTVRNAAVRDATVRDAAFRDAAVHDVRDAAGRVLLADRGGIDGADLAGPRSPLGRFAAFGTLLVLAPPDRLPSSAVIDAAAAAHGCIAGTGSAPNAAGLAVRLLAPAGGALARALDAVFAVGFEAMLGAAPARRRK